MRIGGEHVDQDDFADAWNAGFNFEPEYKEVVDANGDISYEIDEEATSRKWRRTVTHS